MDWDLTAYFPSFAGEEHCAFEAALERDAGALRDRLGARTPHGLGSASARATLLEALTAYEALGVRFKHLSSYIGALAAADGNNAEYRRAEARLSAQKATLTALEACFVSALAELAEPELEDLLAAPELAGAHYYVLRLRQRARHSMSPEHEALAAQLGTDGIEAWGRLYNRLTAALSFELPGADGTPRRVPFAARRSLLEGPERSVRKAAFEAGNRALESIVPTLAAALNHIAGTRLTLYRQRKIGHFLEPALFQAGISRAALDAMYEAVRRQSELPRRVLRAKARAMGLSALAYYDLGAPFPVAEQPNIEWPAALGLVERSFAQSYPRLAEFFRQSLARRWVDHEPRSAKRPGAFCTSSPLIEQSRIFMTFQGTFGDVSTLAHETGHAFHNHVLAGTRFFARQYPMTLAESASTFAEMLLADGIAEEAGQGSLPWRAVQSSLLNDAATFVLDITARFRFETAFYAERQHGELDAERLSELMANTQTEVFGDVLHVRGVDPLFWASKLHFFITGVSFYNFPYTFGYLLSRGMFQAFKREGRPFLVRYEEFLRQSAATSAEVVARDVLGFELEAPEFWERSIASLGEPLALFEAER